MADENKETKPISNGIQPGPGEHILDAAVQPATSPDSASSRIGSASSAAGSSGGLDTDSLSGSSSTTNPYTAESVSASLARADYEADQYAQDLSDRASGGYSTSSYSGMGNSDTTGANTTFARAQNYVREAPGTVLIGTLVAGFLVSRLLKSTSTQKYEYTTTYPTTKSPITERMKQVGDTARAKLQDTTGAAQARMSQVGQRVQESKGAAQARMNEMTQRLKESASVAQARMNEMGQRSQQQYTRARSEVERLMDEQPLIVGVVGIALGAAIGATLKPTRREQELMGGMRDKLMERAKETARAQAETLKQSAQRIAEAAKQEASQVAKAATGTDAQGTSKTASSGSKEPGDSQFGSLPGQPSIH
jgi:ElaB/YqjD/DUF883 family membrane-anchored ribosome-binding protein